MAVPHGRTSLLFFRLPPPVQRSNQRFLQVSSARWNRNITFECLPSSLWWNCPSVTKDRRFRGLQQGNPGSADAAETEIISDDGLRNSDILIEGIEKSSDNGSFFSKLGIVLGVGALITLVCISIKSPSQVGSSSGIQFIPDGSSPSALSPTSSGFSFHVFGYRVVLPEYAPGWAYFWLLMAAGCGLFISEEALNIWVGITFARLLSLDGTWQAFVESFSRNSSYIISTAIWVYWGVAISDMIPFYLGKLLRRSSASGDIVSKMGLGKEKATKITSSVQKYGNLIGFVERFSIGVRNPTAFLAGAMDVSAECFFAGVCCGALITLPLQLAVGFLLRERPLVTITAVATVVGMWTALPYALAASAAILFYLRRRYLK